MDGTTVPDVWISGYELLIPGCESWSHVPVLYWNRVVRKVLLPAYDAGRRDSDWAVPASR